MRQSAFHDSAIRRKVFEKLAQHLATFTQKDAVLKIRELAYAGCGGSRQGGHEIKSRPFAERLFRILVQQGRAGISGLTEKHAGLEIH